MTRSVAGGNANEIFFIKYTDEKKTRNKSGLFESFTFGSKLFSTKKLCLQVVHINVSRLESPIPVFKIWICFQSLLGKWYEIAYSKLCPWWLLFVCHGDITCSDSYLVRCIILSHLGSEKYIYIIHLYGQLLGVQPRPTQMTANI